MRKLIYLDNHATTPCDPRVVEVMLPFFSEVYANPSSVLHRAGREVSDAVENARVQVASLIGAEPSEIVFTSGATESNNLAILGTSGLYKGTRRKVVTSAIEHKSVLESCRYLSDVGVDVIVLPTDSQGIVNLEIAEKVIDGNTLLVSLQFANQEVGTLQPVAQITAMAHQHGVLVHCDAAQAAGKVPVDVRTLGIDLLSFNAHKMYGPKGIGALYIRREIWHRLCPIILGGGQERGLRSGTLNVPAIIGFGKACNLCKDYLPTESERLQQLRNQMEAVLIEAIPGLILNGDLSCRLPHNSSLTFPDIEADALILSLPDCALSTTSACASGAIEPSHVLLAIGLTREQAFRTVRIGLGRFNDDEQVETVCKKIIDMYRQLVSI